MEIEEVCFYGEVGELFGDSGRDFLEFFLVMFDFGVLVFECLHAAVCAAVVVGGEDDDCNLMEFVRDSDLLEEEVLDFLIFKSFDRPCGGAEVKRTILLFAQPFYLRMKTPVDAGENYCGACVRCHTFKILCGFL